MREREAVDYSFNCTFFVCDGLLFIPCLVCLVVYVAGPPFHVAAVALASTPATAALDWQ